eukprot:2969687-Amphidinium_carterae.1
MWSLSAVKEQKKGTNISENVPGISPVVQVVWGAQVEKKAKSKAKAKKGEAASALFTATP